MARQTIDQGIYDIVGEAASGDIGLSTAILDDIANDGVTYVFMGLPREALLHMARQQSTFVPATGVIPGNSQIILVLRSDGNFDRECKEIPQWMAANAADPRSIYKATDLLPVYYIEAQTSTTAPTLKILPVDTGSVGKLIDIEYPTIAVGTDKFGQIVGFPDELADALKFYILGHVFYREGSLSRRTAQDEIEAINSSGIHVAISTSFTDVETALDAATTNLNVGAVSAALSEMGIANSKIAVAVPLANTEYDKVSSILDSSNTEVDKVTDILDSANTEVDKLVVSGTGPLDLINTEVDKMASILDSANTAIDKVANIVVEASGQFDAAASELGDAVVGADTSIDNALAIIVTAADRILTSVSKSSTEIDKVVDTAGNEGPIELANVQFDLIAALILKGETDSEGSFNTAMTAAKTALDKVLALVNEGNTEVDVAVTEAATMYTSGSGTAEITDFGAAIADAQTQFDEAVIILSNEANSVDRLLVASSATDPADVDVIQLLKDGKIDRAGVALRLSDGRVREAGAHIAAGQAKIAEARAEIEDWSAQWSAISTQQGIAQGFFDSAKGYLGEAEGYIKEAQTHLQQAQAKRDEGKARAEAGNAFLGEAASRLSAADSYLKELDTDLKHIEGKTREIDSRVKQVDAWARIANGYVQSGQGYLSEAEGYIKEAQGYIAEANGRAATAASYGNEVQARISTAVAYYGEASERVKEAGGYIAEADSRVKGGDAYLREAQMAVAEAGSFAKEVEALLSYPTGYLQEAQMRLGKISAFIQEAAVRTQSARDIEERGKSARQEGDSYMARVDKVVEEYSTNFPSGIAKVMALRAERRRA